jgi:hypothetical protein
LTTLVLALSLVAQAPPPEPVPAPPQAAQVAPKPGARREAEIRKTIEKRKEARQRMHLQGRQRRDQDRAQAEAEAKVAAVRAAQARDQYLMTQEAQRTQALQGLAEAARVQAQSDRARYVLESQALGQSQVLVPGQGFAPYPYSIAPPLRPYP